MARRKRRKLNAPADKEPVGERLALLARAKVYGETVDCYGPVFQTLKIDGGDALVEWAYAEGLHFTNGIAQGFEVSGADGVFVPAQAEVLPSGRVRVYSPGVPDLTGVRYGWFNWGEVSLFNAQGLPAAPFSWINSEGGLKAGANVNLHAASNRVGDGPPIFGGLVRGRRSFLNFEQKLIHIDYPRMEAL